MFIACGRNCCLIVKGWDTGRKPGLFLASVLSALGFSPANACRTHSALVRKKFVGDSCKIILSQSLGFDFWKFRLLWGLGLSSRSSFREMARSRKRYCKNLL